MPILTTDNDNLREQIEASLSGMFAEPRYVVDQFWPLVEASKLTGEKQAADLLHRLNAICDLVTVWRDATPGYQFGRRGELRQILDLARGED